MEYKTKAVITILRGFRYEDHTENSADASDIQEIEENFGSPLPLDYREVLTRFDGYDGFINRVGGDLEDVRVSFIPAKDVLESNTTLEVAEHEPKLLLVGTDGAEEGLFLRRPDEPGGDVEWVRLPLLDIGDTKPGSRLEHRAPSLDAFLDYWIKELGE